MKQQGILILGNYPPPFGGVPRHIESLVPYLVRQGWDVHVLAGGSRGFQKKSGASIHRPSVWRRLDCMLTSLRKTCCFRPVVSWNRKDLLRHTRDWFRYNSFIAYGRKIIRENNIKVISAYNLYIYAPIGAVLSQEFNIPLVVTNFGELYGMGGYFERNREVLAHLTGISHRLLAMSRHCAKSYDLFQLSPDVEVIPYGVDINMFSTDTVGSAVRAELGIQDDDKVVLFVGRLKKDMGLHTVMDAIPHVLRVEKKMKFIIVGEKGELFEGMLKLMDEYKQQIFVIPRVPFEKLPEYYAAADIVVAPTQGNRACGSLAALEAMASGKAVIAAKIGGIPEIVIDNEIGRLIPPETPMLLAQAIVEMAHDDALREKMGRAGRNRAESIFDESVSNQKIETLFRDAVSFQ